MKRLLELEGLVNKAFRDAQTYKTPRAWATYRALRAAYERQCALMTGVTS